jgi:xylose isomerase
MAAILGQTASHRNGEPKLESGRQELRENLINEFI